MKKNDADATAYEGFLAILSLLTRLPLPALHASAYAAAPRTMWAYPLVGVIVGAIMALAATVSLSLGLPAGIAAGVALAAAMIATGAMHEDGLADTCDGFWGGFEPARRLEIMKDSQIGSYGVLALIVMIGLRWLAIAATLLTISVWPLIAAAALSRALLPLLMALTPQARNFGLSHSVGRPESGPALAALALGLLIAMLCGGSAAIWAMLLAGLALLALRRIALAKIGGQTGDVLGAAQQIAELTVLLTLLALTG